MMSIMQENQWKLKGDLQNKSILELTRKASTLLYANSHKPAMDM